MPTLVYVEGWEHGVYSVNGGGIANTTHGTAPTVQSAEKRTGTYALKSTAAAGTSDYIKNLAASAYYLVGRFYFKVVSGQWPTSQSCILYANVSPYMCIFLTDGDVEKKIGIGYGSTLLQKSGVITEDVWHQVDFKIDGHASPWTIDAKVDGVALTQGTYASAAALIPGFDIGLYHSTTGTVYFDDLVLSQTPGDYPIGPGGVEGLYPSGAGVSNPTPSVTNIQDNGSVTVDDGSNPANVELDEVPLGSGTDYIKQVGGTSSIYAAVAFADTDRKSVV